MEERCQAMTDQMSMIPWTAKTQRERILAMLRERPFVPCIELSRQFPQYGARIYELRHKQGLKIINREDDRGSGFVLVEG